MPHLKDMHALTVKSREAFLCFSLGRLLCAEQESAVSPGRSWLAKQSKTWNAKKQRVHLPGRLHCTPGRGNCWHATTCRCLVAGVAIALEGYCVVVNMVLCQQSAIVSRGCQFLLGALLLCCHGQVVHH